jgi:hypothetical protein
MRSSTRNHEFTKIEATPVRHDFCSRDAPVITFLLRDASPRGEKEKNRALIISPFFYCLRDIFLPLSPFFIS